MQLYIDYTLVLVAGFIGALLFCLWHSSFLFQNFYPNKLSKKGKYLGSFFLFPITYAIAFLQQYLQVSSFWDGIISSALLYLFFVLPTSFLSFCKESHKIKGPFLADQILWLVEFLLLGAILAG